MSLTESEYTVLRHTIASRGTARITLLPVTLIGWALVAGTLTVLGNNPATSLFPLAVLAGGFEAIHAMHVGVERIGRYLQVFYEGTADGPLWETTAMAVGPALPGGGVDPLFTVIFALATLLNLMSGHRPVTHDTGAVGHRRDARGASRAACARTRGSDAAAHRGSGELSRGQAADVERQRSDYLERATASSVTSWVPFHDSVVSNDSRGECASRPTPPPPIAIDGTPTLIGRFASVDPSSSLTGNASAFSVAIAVSTTGESRFRFARRAGSLPCRSQR